MNDNDKTVRKESVPPMSSGTHEQGGPLLETGMMQPPQTPGTLGMIGKYQVVRILGEGGMGQVLLAREPVTDSLLAVKIIKPEFLRKDWAVHRFLSEARYSFKLSHPSIIRVLEVSDRPEGPFFVMPYMAGGSLAQKIKPGEGLPPDTVLPLARQVAEALQYAHGWGIIHRDLKPSNILLDAEGGACLCDFGLLRTVYNDSMVDVTRPQVEGTVPYLSPAVAEGKAEDTRCDIYGFGCLLYEMLTGQPPYQGPSVEAVLKQILAGPPQPILQLNPQAPARLVAIAEHAMGRELRDRYAAMADVIRDLDRVAEGKEPLGPHGGAKGSHLGRNILAVIGILALVGLAAYILSNLPTRKPSVPAPVSSDPAPPARQVAAPATPAPPPPAAAVQDQFTWTVNNGAVTITRYTGSGGTVIIPSRIDGLPVTGIREQAFAHCAGLASVSIPSSVTYMGATYDGTPFVGCSGLTSVLVDAANPAFSSGADGVLFNKNKTYLVSYPGGRAGSYVIPDSVTTIGRAAFHNCTRLTELTIPDSVTDIQPQAFYDCTNLSNVAIPKGLTSIAVQAFRGCAKFTSVTIPDSVTSIGDSAFNGCAGLTNITIPNSVTTIGEGSFCNCTRLTSIRIPASVTSIRVSGYSTYWKMNMLAGCSALTSIVVDAANPAYSSGADGVLFNKEKTSLLIYPGGKAGSCVVPNNVTKIGYAAFSGCKSLTSVTIPESVTTIEGSAFYRCYSLGGIYFKGNAPKLGKDVFEGIKNRTVRYRSGTRGWGPVFGGFPTAPWNPAIK